MNARVASIGISTELLLAAFCGRRRERVEIWPV